MKLHGAGEVKEISRKEVETVAFIMGYSSASARALRFAEGKDVKFYKNHNTIFVKEKESK